MSTTMNNDNQDTLIKTSPTDILPAKLTDLSLYDICNKDDEIMKTLIKFYSQSHNLDQLLPILQGTSKISLRVLDWFVTNYSKQYDIIYNIKKGTTTRQMVVHSGYKAQLKGYSKKYFDPFCRKKRIYFEYAVGKEIETTVGQLNFFRWAIENKIIDYVTEHLQTIVNDMNLRGSKSSKSTNGVKAKKKQLSVSATKSISIHDVTITVKFT